MLENSAMWPNVARPVWETLLEDHIPKFVDLFRVQGDRGSPFHRIKVRKVGIPGSRRLLQVLAPQSRGPGSRFWPRSSRPSDSFHDELALLRKRGIPNQIVDHSLQGVVA